MSEDEIEKLRKLAEAATPGPWTRRYSHYAEFGDAGEVPEIKVRCQPADAEYIAAANPEAVLALLNRVRALEDTGTYVAMSKANSQLKADSDEKDREIDRLRAKVLRLTDWVEDES